MSALPRAHITPQMYLEIERTADHKSEFINGEIYAMAGASDTHSDISVNVLTRLRTTLGVGRCRVRGSDTRVKIEDTGMYTYPDVVVVCGAPQLEDERRDTLLNPVVIVEVLSRSTESYDRGEKFAHYRRLPSLREYVLIAQDKHRVERFVRQGEQWLLTEFSALSAAVELPSIGCALTLAEIYEGVELNPAEGAR